MALSTALFGPTLAKYKPGTMYTQDATPGRTKISTDNPGLATAMSGLSTQDRWELTENQRRASGNYQRANRAYNTGLQTTENDRRLALLRAAQGQEQATAVGLSAASDSGLGWSPATAGAAQAAAVQQGASNRARAQSDFATARGALERMLGEAEMTYADEAARLTRDAARRRDYYQTIRKYGTN